MKITTKQAQAFIVKGDIPMPRMFLIKSQRGWKVPRLKCNNSFLLQKMLTCQQSAVACARMVAMAAPRMPHPNTQMKIGSRSVFKATVNMVAYIACLGFDADRSTAFIPKYRCVMTLPSRIISI